MSAPKPKYFKCRLKTGGKTIEQIREQNKGQGMTWRDFEKIQLGYNYFDGVELLLSLWDYDNESCYHVSGWGDDVDSKMMMGMYYMEQIHPAPMYKDNFDKFTDDWRAGEYDPGMPFCFDKEDVEELEVLQC